MSLEIDVRGLDRLVRAVGSLRVLEILRAPMIGAMARVVDRMADYPPPPSGSGYRRTGTLGRRWTQTQPSVTATATELVVKVGNNTKYGPWVQNEQFQAGMHRGRWQTDVRVLSDLSGQIQNDLDAAVQRALDEL